MTTTPRNRTHLAELLGIAKSAVTAQAARGMPTDSVEAAQEWRRRNIDPGRKKGNRLDAHYQPRQPVRPVQPAPQPVAPEPDWFALAALSLDLAALVLDGGQSIDVLIPSLRAALHWVPEHERPALPLPLSVISVLVKHVSDALPSPENNPLNDDGTPMYCNTMSEADAQEMGTFWYSVAAGEVRLA